MSRQFMVVATTTATAMRRQIRTLHDSTCELADKTKVLAIVEGGGVREALNDSRSIASARCHHCLPPSLAPLHPSMVPAGPYEAAIAVAYTRDDALVAQSECAESRHTPGLSGLSRRQ